MGSPRPVRKTGLLPREPPQKPPAPVRCRGPGAGGVQPTHGSGASARARLRSRRRLSSLPAPAQATKTRGPQPAVPSWGGDTAGQDPGGAGASPSAPATGTWASAVAHDAPGSSLRSESGKTHLGRAKSASRCPESTHLSAPSPQRRKFPRPAPDEPTLGSFTFSPCDVGAFLPPGPPWLQGLRVSAHRLVADFSSFHPHKMLFPTTMLSPTPRRGRAQQQRSEGCVWGSLLPLKAHFSRGIFRSGLILDFPG